MTSNALRIGMGFAAGALLGLVVVAPAFASERFNVKGLDRVHGPYVGQIELTEAKGKLEVVRSIRFEKGGELQLRGAAERRGGQIRANLSLAAGAAGAIRGAEAGQVQLQVRLQGARCWTRCVEGEQVVARGHGAHPGQELIFAEDLGPKGVGKGKGKGKGKGNKKGQLQSEYEDHNFRGLAFIRGKGDAREIHPNDPEQGALGDCYLLAAMIAIAHTKPHMIRKLITSKEDGSFSVRLHGLSFWGGNVDIDVDDAFPTVTKKHPDFAYGGSSDTLVVKGKTYRELWPSLLEKAYAKHKGGYAKIEGGHSHVPFRFFSGKSGLSYQTFFRSAAGIKSILQNAKDKGYPICVGTKNDTGKLGKRTNLVGNHAYVVWRVKGGKFTLYNPWQRDHPNRAYTAAEIKKLTSHLYIGKF